MKLALVSTFFPFRGGIAAFNHRLCQTLLEAGHEVVVYNFTTQYPEFLFPGKTQYVEGPAPEGQQVEQSRMLSSVNPLSWLTTAKAVANAKPDLVVFRYWMPFFSPAFSTVAWYCKKKGIEVVAILDNLIPHENRPGDHLLNRMFLSQIERFVVMSDVVEKELASYENKKPYAYHPHPLYDHFGAKLPTHKCREALGLPTDKKVLLFFGLIRPYKGLADLLDAFALLSDDYFLVIAGEPYGDFTSYQNQIDQLPNKNHVTTATRYIADHEVATFFGAADVCVLPYRSATQSGIVAIAYHFDLPVIVTDTGGLKKLVEPTRTGLVSPKENPKKLSDTIIQFFEKENPSNFRLGIKRFKEKFTWQNFVEVLLNNGKK